MPEKTAMVTLRGNDGWERRATGRWLFPPVVGRSGGSVSHPAHEGGTDHHPKRMIKRVTGSPFLGEREANSFHIPISIPFLSGSYSRSLSRSIGRIPSSIFP